MEHLPILFFPITEIRGLKHRSIQNLTEEQELLLLIHTGSEKHSHSSFPMKQSLHKDQQELHIT